MLSIARSGELGFFNVFDTEGYDYLDLNSSFLNGGNREISSL